MPLLDRRELSNLKHTSEGRSLSSKRDWVEGWWSNLGPQPIYIKDKHHLKKVCEALSRKTGLTYIPKAFMKPKSQGRGFEWNF